MTTMAAAAEASARSKDAGATRERPNRHTSDEVQALKARDNLTNWRHLARIYLIIALAIAGAVGDPEYREKGVVVEGYFGHGDGPGGNPTALGVLGEAHAPKRREGAYVDNAAIEYADVADAAGIAREVEASLRKG